MNDQKLQRLYEGWTQTLTDDEIRNATTAEAARMAYFAGWRDCTLLDEARAELLAIHKITASVAEVEPVAPEDTLTVQRVKHMAQWINATPTVGIDLAAGPDQTRHAALIPLDTVHHWLELLDLGRMEDVEAGLAALVSLGGGDEQATD